MLLPAGCGGGGGPAPEKTVRGAGFHFAAPGDWAVARNPRVVQASKGVRLVSVTRYVLVHAYRPGLFAHVVPELDRAAAAVARQQNGRVTASRTVTVSGRRARSYELAYSRDGKKLVERITFVLRGKTEFYLLCRYKGGGGTDACERLLATFVLD